MFFWGKQVSTLYIAQQYHKHLSITGVGNQGIPKVLTLFANIPIRVNTVHINN